MSDIDLTASFKEAKAIAQVWNESRFRALLLEIERAVPGIRIDWDEGAGEDWASAINSSEVRAIVGRDAPIAFVFGQDIEPILMVAEAAGMVSIRAPGFEDSIFTVEESSLSDLFRGWTSQLGDVIDLNCFSAADLWWATI